MEAEQENRQGRGTAGGFTVWGFACNARNPCRGCMHVTLAAEIMPFDTRPQAIVGEFGLDRSSLVPGTRLQPSWEHQLQLVKTHLALAAELRRPVSMHCVQVRAVCGCALRHTWRWRRSCGGPCPCTACRCGVGVGVGACGVWVKTHVALAADLQACCAHALRAGGGLCKHVLGCVGMGVCGRGRR